MTLRSIRSSASAAGVISAAAIVASTLAQSSQRLNASGATMTGMPVVDGERAGGLRAS